MSEEKKIVLKFKEKYENLKCKTLMLQAPTYKPVA